MGSTTLLSQTRTQTFVSSKRRPFTDIAQDTHVAMNSRTEDDALTQWLLTFRTCFEIDIAIEVPHLSTVEFVNQKKLVGFEGLIR